MNRMNAVLTSLAPHALRLLRIVVGLLFLPHGLVKLFAFSDAVSESSSGRNLIWYQGIIELLGGPLLILGLFTRPVAFILAGDMAFAYFMSHAPRSVYSIQNSVNLAILYCFVFFLSRVRWSRAVEYRRQRFQRVVCMRRASLG